MMEEQAIDKVRQIIVETVTRAIREKGSAKPEHMTSLRGSVLVCKDHPRIAFRGAIDSLESEIILVQIRAKEKGMLLLERDLGEIIRTIRWLLRCEVSGEPVGNFTLQGLTAEELRAHSHHPSQYYGMKHFLPTAEQGEMAAHLNHLRTKAREAELVAYKAFKEADGSVSREDILRVFNRLSSLFWIMMFKYLTGIYTAAGMVEVEASGRHVHLSRKDVETLFGAGYQLTKVRDLSQPGQYVCKERISVTGPKGTVQNVVVLGPERKETQVEISLTDSLALGIRPPVRQSGDIEGSPGALLQNGTRQLTIHQGVIVAKRHMHVAEKDADRLQVKDGEILDIEVLGTRPVIFKDTVVRVRNDFATYVHIDYDEANACGFEKGMLCRILR